MITDGYELTYDDYAQSANTLFHFMTKSKYLEDILLNKAIVPRYCKENLAYLHIRNGEVEFTEALVLQKCFCDIPFHKLMESFRCQPIGENYENLNETEKEKVPVNYTHPDFYGEFGIAFSKSWGEEHNLQPIHYLNECSQYAKDFSDLINQIISSDDMPDIYADDITNRLVFVKPLRGVMKRDFTKENGVKTEIEFQKNFHDEQEWRYVPSIASAEAARKKVIIANKKLIQMQGTGIDVNNDLLEDKYKSLWLTFNYDDIKYIIVPNKSARIEIIEKIMSIPDKKFSDFLEIKMQKYILISKILVLEEVRKDW